MQINYELFGSSYQIETDNDDSLTPSMPDYSNSHQSTIELINQSRSKYGFALDPNSICNEDLVFVCQLYYQNVSTSSELDPHPIPNGAFT